MNPRRLLMDAAGLPPDPIYDPTHLHLDRYQAVRVPRLRLSVGKLAVELRGVWFWLPAIILPIPYDVEFRYEPEHGTLWHRVWALESINLMFWLLWKRDRPPHTALFSRFIGSAYKMVLISHRFDAK